MRGWVVIVLACTACGGAQTAPVHGGIESPRLIVIAPSGSDEDLDFDVPGTAVVPAPAAAASAAAEASPALERARTLYRDLAFEESLAAVGEAQIVLERAPRAREDFLALHRALVYRAMNELALGREARADEALRHAVSIAPSAVLDEGVYPPDVRSRYDTIRTAMRAEPPASIAVVTEPAGATVTLDGSDAGRTPATLHGAPGRHYVGLSAAGHAPRVVPIELAADASPLRVSLARASYAESVAQIAAEDPSALAALPAEQRRAIVDALRVDRVVHVEPSGPERWSGTEIDLEAGETRSLAPRGDTLRDAIASMIRETRVPRSEPPAEESSVFESPWLWIGAAVLAAGAAVGVYFIARDPGYEVVLQ